MRERTHFTQSIFTFHKVAHTHTHCENSCKLIHHHMHLKKKTTHISVVVLYEFSSFNWIKCHVFVVVAVFLHFLLLNLISD